MASSGSASDDGFGLISAPAVFVVSAAIAAIALAIASLGERGGLSLGAVLIVAPFALAGLIFAGAALAWSRDRQRSRVLAAGAAILLGAWVVAVGYGRLELASGLVASLGALAATTTMLGGAEPDFGLLLTGVVVSVALLAVRIARPPEALLALYAIAAIGMSAATLGVLLPLLRQVPVVAVALIALLAWAASAALLFVTFGPPLAPS